LLDFNHKEGKLKDKEYYKIIEPVSSDAIGHWVKDYPRYENIIGYSSLGLIFLFSPSQSDYIVYYPFSAAAKSYGTFDSISEFEKEILQDEDFSEYVLKPDHVQKLMKAVGSLSEDEVYIPQPYPFLGGNESIDSYDKGNIWVMLDLVSQLLADNA